MKHARQTRDWLALTEALTLFAMIMAYIWWVRLYHPWLALAIPGVVLVMHGVRRETPVRLGFGWNAFRRAFPKVMPWAAALVCMLLATGALMGTTRRTSWKHAALGILAYSIWGLVQQYLLNGYFVLRLLEFERSGRRFVPLAAATLFSLAHLPNWFLMAVTFAGGYICVRLYLEHRSLYVLALAHGLVGFVLYLVVPDSVSGHFLVGPRYLLHRYGTYPELLL